LFDWDLSISFDRKINLAMVGTCPSQMTVNQIILAPAYWELIDLFRTRTTIRHCKRKDCNNIFHVTHQGREYCFDKVCEAKRSAESSKKSDNFSRNRIRTGIAQAIDEWLEDEVQISASELMYEIPNIAKIMRNKNDPAKSLGTYLTGRIMKDLLREKGIELTFKKEGNTNLYCFERLAIP
jgi:hypothetical protein